MKIAPCTLPALITLAVSGCTTMSYGDRTAVAIHPADMAASTAYIQETERRERAEYRRERRELLMDEADAIRRATTGGHTVYFIR